MAHLTISNSLISKSQTDKNLVFLTVDDYNDLVNTLNAKINGRGDAMWGQLKAVGDPIDDLDIASKLWVEGFASQAAITAATNLENQLQAHIKDLAAHSATSAATPSTFALRDAGAQVSVTAPTEQSHALRLVDVQNLEGSLQAHLNAANPHPTATSTDAVANKLMMRNANGSCSVQDPQTDLDVVNRRTLMAQVTNILNNYSAINPGAPKNGDILVQGSTIYICSAGAWRQVWPAQFADGGTPQAGLLLSVYCSGFDLHGTYTNGAGGTYDQIIQPMSRTCGAIPISPTQIRATRVSAGSLWNSWLNSRAIIFTTTDQAANFWNHYVGFTWSVNLPQTGTYTLQYAVDDSMEFWIDSTQLGIPVQDNYLSGPNTLQFGANAGAHSFTIGVLNIAQSGGWGSNPTGVGFIIYNPDGSVFLDSANFTFASPAVANGYALTNMSDGSVIGVK